MNIACIVEGHGEVQALPVLLRRLLATYKPEVQVDIDRPIVIHRDRFISNDDEFSKFLRLAASRAGKNGWVLILLDADDDCPVNLSQSLYDKVAQIIPGHRVSLVLANKEYEGWFIASALSLNGVCNLQIDAAVERNPDDIRGAKEWLSKHMPPGISYKEVIDQPRLSARFDFDMAIQNSRSFRKFFQEWDANVYN
ncbi:DUF4276 family protein [Asticcacaulis taihuensis]|uniref:DUF4276 family protein n=1 Tax=Asticcacaulis taihuensis TaxID=260084 RepID=UPI0026EE25A5|nr:DUF4276 family protein [Asticcacaulis taihuensis]